MAAQSLLMWGSGVQPNEEGGEDGEQLCWFSGW